MKTLKNKEFYKCGRKKCDRYLPCIYSEDLKQAIKDLKRNIIGNRRIDLQEIDKIMGVWEE